MFVFLEGMKLGLGLILVIGAQNAFVLRQGIRREHVFLVCLICALSDAILIAAGVAGIDAATEAFPGLLPALKWGGIAFLTWYGARAFWAAWRGGEALRTSGTQTPVARSRVLLTCLALTWLNPHVWLDTVVLLGSIAAQFPGAEWHFGAGAMTGSFVFFFSLGYGARVLAPIFARPTSWRILDVLIGMLMWSIALRLALA